MVLRIHPVAEREKAAIDRMAAAYFAEVLPDGPRYYPAALDRYWHERGRHPYLIRLDGQDIGFALVWNHRDGTHELAEFTILPAHRHQGLGTEAAHLIFEALGGDWVLGVATSSPGGLPFWRACLEACPGAVEIVQGPPRTQSQSGSFTFRIER